MTRQSGGNEPVRSWAFGVLAVIVLGASCSTGIAEQDVETNAEQIESSQVESENVGGVRPISVEPTDGSVLDWLPPEETIGYTDGERYLASLAVSPSEFADPLRTSLVQIDDPNGNARIEGRWYEPRIIEEDCAFKTDQAPIPFVRAVYLPGEPSQSTTRDQFAALQAPMVFGLELSLFDSREQRDSFAEILREATFFADQMQCSMFEDGGDDLASELFPSVEEIPAPEIGYPGFGIRLDSTFQAGFAYQYSVGEWALLKVSVASVAMEEGESKEPPTPAMIEPFLNSQIEQLKSAGLG